jgi:CBS domain-containing protein
MKASDIMTRRVVTVRADASILEAGRLMLESKISGLPVVDGGGRLVGIVTERDFLRRAEMAAEPKRPRWF